MAELKTKLNDASVEDFLNTVEDESKRRDSFTILNLMREVTKTEPKMWGDTIIGFGSYHYRYASGREGDAPIIGFSPRKQNLTLYLNLGYDHPTDLLDKLGKHKTGKGCLYINRLSEVDLTVLKELVERSNKPPLAST